MHGVAPLPRARVDGWTPERQAAFLDSLAQGHSVEAACRQVGLSPQSAYAFRLRAAGQPFAAMWRAARILGRDALAECAVSRALDGYTETTERDGVVTTRFRHDNRLLQATLTRLDRVVDEEGGGPWGAAARALAGAWEEAIDIVEHQEASPAALAMLLKRRTIDEAPLPEHLPMLSLAEAHRFLAAANDDDALLADDWDEEDDHEACDEDEDAADPEHPAVDTADLVVAERQGWTAEQWDRAEAAGLVTLECPPDEWLHKPQQPQLPAPEYDGHGRSRRVRWGDGPWRWAKDAVPPEPEDARIAVWMLPGDPDAIVYTCFPPPPGFDGLERGGVWGDDGYWRACTLREAAGARAANAKEQDARRAYEERARNTAFGFAPYEDEEEEEA